MKPFVYFRAAAYNLEEYSPNIVSPAQFGMKGGGEHIALAYQHGIALVRTQYFHSRSDLQNPRSPNEDTLYFATANQLDLVYEAIDLPPVGIAFDFNVDQVQRWLARPGHFPGQEYGAGAGAKNRLPP